jgi:hypothetical protein
MKELQLKRIIMVLNSWLLCTRASDFLNLKTKPSARFGGGELQDKFIKLWTKQNE